MIYQNDKFTIYSNKVVQGEYMAKAISPDHISSNYLPGVQNQYPRLIEFKLAVNQHDNELPFSVNHWVLLTDEHQPLVIKFGELPKLKPVKPPEPLPYNFTYTFRFDVSPLFDAFENNGYYEGANGQTINKEDFEGIYIAGSNAPLNWDFGNLKNQGLRLNETTEKNIYEITLTLNPRTKPEKNQNRSWQLKIDVSDKPQYSSDQPIVDALYNLSLEEAKKAIEPDRTLRTGAKWAGVWTRDISYSIYLAFAVHEPEVAKNSLRKKVNRGRIIQDTGSGGAYPVSSDRTVWAIAAWELYKVTGDREWLEEIYQVIKKSIDDDFQVIRDPETGLFKGESSFLDWREQSYPRWMDNADIYNSENLGTNIAHFKAHYILAQMAKELGKINIAALYGKRADSIKKAINEHLWIKDRGYYGQYVYGRNYLNLSIRPEALGEALSILFDVADKNKSKSIIENYPVIPFGASCFYPQIKDIPSYHNNGIWPFVQAYWNLAAAKTGNETALNHGLAAIYRPAALFLSNYENFVAESGDNLGTEINSPRMLWSMAGNLAMVYRVFMGMSFETNGIRFAPVIPEPYQGTRKLSGFKYRNATLTIEVQGIGNQVKEYKLDGHAMEELFFPANLSGEHHICIVMQNNPFKGNTNMVNNYFSLPLPEARIENNTLKWTNVKGAINYKVYKNGAELLKTNTTNINIDPNETSEYKITAIDSLGWESFTSEPILVFNPKNEMIFLVEDFAPSSPLPYKNYLGDGFVEISTSTNRKIKIRLDIEEAGSYLISFRYSNGSGPWNTENKCAFRDFIVNGEKAGVFVFPQRGENKWDDWGWSNSLNIELHKGGNTLHLTFEPWNNNMNVEVNNAMLDCFRLIKITN